MRQEYENEIRKQPKIKRIHNNFRIAEYEDAFGLHRQLLTEAKNFLATERRIKSWHNAAIDLLFVRAFDTFNSILLLCENGYGTDALILLRSLFINYIYCKYIMTGNKDELGLRFIRYEKVVAKKLYAAPAEDKMYYEQHKEILDSYDDEYKKFNDDYSFGGKNGKNKIDLREWTGKTLCDLSIFVDEKEYYDTVFFVTSASSHVNSFSVSRALDPEAKDYETDVGASDREVNKALFISEGFFIHILDFWATSFNVKFDGNIYIDKLKAIGAVLTANKKT